MAGRARYLDERAQVVLQAFLVTLGHYVYDYPGSTQQGLAHVLATEHTRQAASEVREVNEPETVDSDIVSLFGGRCENLKQLHQDRWKKVDDDVSLRGMKALREKWKQNKGDVK